MAEYHPARDMIGMLEAALAPVEPAARFGNELESRLADLQAAALEELSEWELGAMRDPRNWARPAAAVAVGTAAGAALLLVRMRRTQRQRGLQAVAGQARRDVREAIGGARQAIDGARARLR